MSKSQRVQRTRSVPRDVFNTEVKFGLNYFELLTLGAVPLIFILPATFIDRIPLVGIVAILALGYAGVGVLIVKTPEGQSPTTWGPEYLRSYFAPDRYTLQPQSTTSSEGITFEYQDVFYTEHRIKDEWDQLHNPDESLSVEQLQQEVYLGDQLSFSYDEVDDKIN